MAGSPLCTTGRDSVLAAGTPTVLPIELLRRLLTACFEAFAVEDGAEITSEANPGTVSLAYLRELRRLGINRLSWERRRSTGESWPLLGRIHSAEQVALTVGRARAAGFDNLNLDLIYGLPDKRRLCGDRRWSARWR